MTRMYVTLSFFFMLLCPSSINTCKQQLRLNDYRANQRFPNPPPATGFGAPAAGGFGQPATGGFGSGPTSAFGTSQPQSTGFGMNQPSQPSGFGTPANTGGGLFGQNKPAGSLFGNPTGNQPQSTPFGSAAGAGAPSGMQNPFGQTPNANQGTGFGAQNNTGGLFGSQNKTPFGTNSGATSAGGGLFGATPSTAGQTGASPFATSQQNTASPFGQTPNTGFGGGGGLFGGQNQQQQQQQPKPLFSAFAPGNQQQNQQQQPAPSGFGSGGTGSLFGGGAAGATGGSSIFGAPQQQPQQPSQPQQPGGLFGSQNTQQNPPAGGGLFGNMNQQQQPDTSKPGGLFSTPSTTNNSMGLFGGGASGAANQQQQTQQPQQPAGGLFGNTQQQPKPSLFGPPAQTGQPAGGLFSNTPGANTGGTAGAGGGLFSNLGGGLGQKPATGGGGQTGTNTGGGGLFGNNSGGGATGGTLGGGGLFGQNNATGNASGGIFGSAPQGQQQPQQQQQQNNELRESMLKNPFGNQSIFSDLPPSSTSSPGPLMTPLNMSTKRQKPALYNPSPSVAKRVLNPPSFMGYGGYSTYGSPSKNISLMNSSSVLGTSMRSSTTLAQSLKRPSSSAGLNRSFRGDESVLAPGALAPATPRATSTPTKNFSIDRGLRTDLLDNLPPASPSQTPKASQAATSNSSSREIPGFGKTKKVAFDTPLGGKTPTATTKSPALFETPTKPVPAFENGFGAAHTPASVEPPRDIRPSLFPKPAAATPSVTESAGAAPTATANGPSFTPLKTPPQQAEPKQDEVAPEVGDYWMEPSRETIERMSEAERKHVTNFTVGRHGCGSVTFEAPVDLTAINLDTLYDKIVCMSVRHLSVYPNAAIKPAPGEGLNVQAILRIEKSWPRIGAKNSRTSGPALAKFVSRLKKRKDAEFISFDEKTGLWVTRVAHF